MIKQVISEIKQQLQCANIIDCQINEYQLQKLYDGMIDQSMHPEDYFPYFVSYGLLLLHLDTHNQLLDSSNEEQCRNIILYGDLFDSLYYEYSIKHTFSLIKHNMARVLESIEIQSIHHQNSSVYLLNTWIKIMKQEGLNDGLLI